MKKFLYLLLPFLLLGHASQAQETRPSPWFPEDAEWYYGIHDINMGMGMATGCIHMTVAKDTLFAGRPCKQLSCHRLNDRGESEFTLRAASLMPGIYLYSLIADGKVIDTHRMVVTE